MAKVQAAISSYEELRRRKLEENKKKLEELNLTHLSQSLREATSPKPSPAKSLKRKTNDMELIVVRRSDRVAKLPAASYKEDTAGLDNGVSRRLYYRRTGSSHSSHRDLAGRVYASDEARSYAFTRAEEVQAGLDPDIPSFVKPMTQSHVTGGFWLGLSKHWCTKYLPRTDSNITLIDEQGEESQTLWLAQKMGLSAGWRGFSIAHKLVDGDALVFQRVERTTFKVYIIRECEYYESS